MLDEYGYADVTCGICKQCVGCECDRGCNCEVLSALADTSESYCYDYGRDSALLGLPFEGRADQLVPYVQNATKYFV
jgi:hypothetical protein